MLCVGQARQRSVDAHRGGLQEHRRLDKPEGGAGRAAGRLSAPGSRPWSAGRGSRFKGQPRRPGQLTCALAANSHPTMERPQRALLLGAAGLLLLLLPLSSSSSSDACGPCVPASCPALPPLGCPLGETRDACGCCPVCARGEGEPCGGGAAGRGHCAPGMECVKSRKRRKGKAGAAAGGPTTLAVCVCKSRYPVCGSDGTTYSSGCQLRAASLRAESRGEKAITQVSKGTCEQGGHQRFPARSLPPPLQGIPKRPATGRNWLPPGSLWMVLFGVSCVCQEK